MLRRNAILTVLLATSLPLAACGKKSAKSTPAPNGNPSGTGDAKTNSDKGIVASAASDKRVENKAADDPAAVAKATPDTAGAVEGTYNTGMMNEGGCLEFQFTGAAVARINAEVLVPLTAGSCPATAVIAGKTVNRVGYCILGSTKLSQYSLDALGRPVTDQGKADCANYTADDGKVVSVWAPA